MILHKRILALVLLLFAASCQSSSHIRIERVAELGEWMTGTFSSASQAAAQPDDYYDVRLVMVPIWTERADGPWLYVEQAIGTALDRPYRQRVYHLVEDERGLVSEVYTLPGDPLAFAGRFEDAAFAEVSPEDLSLREGCAIFLARVGGAFAGSTNGADCGSTLRGASYATSEVTVEPDRLTSWDRGFDGAGVQVWGAEKGAYVFERIESAF